jgi:alpha-ketoglutarate-dependent taurine dioxygenase
MSFLQDACKFTERSEVFAKEGLTPPFEKLCNHLTTRALKINNDATRKQQKRLIERLLKGLKQPALQITTPLQADDVIVLKKRLALRAYDDGAHFETMRDIAAMLVSSTSEEQPKHISQHFKNFWSALLYDFAPEQYEQALARTDDAHKVQVCDGCVQRIACR